MLILTRKEAKYADKVRSYKVLIDGAKVGAIRNGETLKFDLPEGKHSLQLKIDWCSSMKVHFDVTEGQDIVAECGPAKKPFLIGEFLYITLLMNRYIDLKLK